MTEYASIEDLTAVVAPDTRDVELAGGMVVKVRGMTRMEMMLTRKNTDDTEVIEQRMLAFCMVEPRLTPGQAAAWQKATGPMVIAPVTEAIRELSGLGEGADKSSVRTDGGPA
jgi:hypothetical protein